MLPPNRDRYHPTILVIRRFRLICIVCPPTLDNRPDILIAAVGEKRHARLQEKPACVGCPCRDLDECPTFWYDLVSVMIEKWGFQARDITVRVGVIASTVPSLPERFGVRVFAPKLGRAGGRGGFHLISSGFRWKGRILPDKFSMLSIFPICVIAPALHLSIRVNRTAVVRSGRYLRKLSSRRTALIPRIVAPAHKMPVSVDCACMQ